MRTRAAPHFPNLPIQSCETRPSVELKKFPASLTLEILRHLANKHIRAIRIPVHVVT